MKQEYLSHAGMTENPLVDGTYLPQYTGDITNTYHYGVDLPTPNPDYFGILISEAVVDESLEGVDKSWIKDQIVTDAKAAGIEFDSRKIYKWWISVKANESVITSTFTIDSSDETTDDYHTRGAALLVESGFLVKTRIPKSQSFSVVILQEYYRPDMKRIGSRYAIRSIALITDNNYIQHQLQVVPEGAETP